ncbi:Ig-like domain-containing protein [Aquimarina litoralis]
MNERSKISKKILSFFLYGMLLFFVADPVLGQVSLVDEIKISNQALFFDGSKVPEEERLTYPNRSKYDYAFGSRITPHGDCIYTYKEYVFMTWYKGGESNRHVMLTRYNMNTKTQVTIQFPHKHTGFQNRPHIGESHNTIAVGIAPVDGTVHLLYDMHAYSKNRPSNGSLSNDYFRYSYSRDNVATLPDEEFTLDKFFPKRLFLKNGDNYEGLTYPTFFNNEAGELFVSMREGGNNNGKYMTAKYNGNSWSSFKDFNVLNAKNRGINYNWGLYGDFKFINGKMHIGFHTRKNISNDKFSLNNGFYYAYAENSNNLTNWKDHKGRSVSTPLIDPEKIFISEPGNTVSGSARNSVKISSGADWTITENGSIHFRTRVIGASETKNVHTYKKAGDDNFRTSTNFPGGDFHSIGNDVYLIGLESGRPVIYKAKGGTNSWDKIYNASSGKSFRHGVVHIKDGILYYYLMERGSGSGQPIYLQVIDLGLNAVANTAPNVQITGLNNSYNVGEDVSITINASDSDGNIAKHEVFVNGNLVDTDGANYTPHQITNVQAGSYTVRVVVTDNDGATDEDTDSFTVSGSSGGGDTCDTYEEENGLVVIETENLSASGNWSERSAISGFTGGGYLEWTGPDHFNDPGNGVITTKIKINSPGRYKFQWRSKVGEGNSPTEANDTWLKFPDASDFYAQKGNEIVYPKGSGKTPNPEGSGGEGYFKVYSTGTTNWTWTTKVSDNDPHDVFVEFDAPGTYTMLISGRSKHHIIDRVTLNKSSVNATDTSLQETTCDGNDGGGSDGDGSVVISGERKKWHKVTLTFDGPNTSETAGDNPFLNYRLNVTFTHQSGSPSYVVPGYYAADGNAAQTSANNGNKWRVHFAPDKTGQWNYNVSFRKGNNVAVNDGATAGTVAGFMNGKTGSFSIEASDKTGRDFRGKGRLQYVGEHYLKFAETGEYMIKQGPDSPENLFAYDDFDNTPNEGNRRKDYQPHINDWDNGDPTWKNGKGKGLIGAVNYIASEGLNSMSFLTMNINGDDKNVYPYIASNQRTRMDVSKLAQWAIVIEHMQENGIFAHFKTQETENETLLDNGNTGNQRKLYYRELIARFGYNLALNWNLGEENGGGPQSVDQSPAQERAMAEYFYKHDPYRHHVVIHKHPNDFPDYLTGNQSRLTGFSLQTNKSDFANVFSRVKEGIDKSRNSGKKWAIACDEPGDAQHAIRPDNNAASSHTDGRKNALWATLLAGGWGNEWYFGYQNAHSDLTLQDFRSRDKWWDYGRHAIRFFNITNLPLTEMRNNNGLSSSNNDYCYAKQGEAYVVYLKNGGSTNLNLNGQSGQFTIKWYNPRNGGNLVNGSVTSVSGGGNRSLGTAPNSTSSDWIILITKNGSDPGENEPPSVSFANPSGNTSIQEGYSSFEVTVNASDSDGTIDNVKLYVDGNLIRQELLAPYTWGQGNNTDELLGLSVGQHIIKAEATDDDGATTSKTFTLTVTGTGSNQGPNVSFASPSNDITVQEGYDLVVIVNASDPDGSVSNVKLYINDNLVRQENIAPYEWGHDGSPNPQEVNGLAIGTHSFKAVATDNEGNTSETAFILTVQSDDNGDGDNNNSCSFDTPANSGLAAMDKVTYSNVHVLGNNGPKFSNFRKFTINWAPQNNGLYQFAINTNNGSPDWYVDFKNTMTFQLQNAQPEVTLNDTGFDGLDGAYWVARDGENLTLVSKSWNYTIYFSNSPTAPNCNRSNPETDLIKIKAFPNPVLDSYLLVTGMMSEELKTLQIISVDGRVVKEINTKNETETIDVSELPSGSYFLSIKAARFKESLLFVKK